MRKPIFDTIRVARGKGFTNAEVAEINALLAKLGIEPDEEPAAPGPAPAPAPPADSGAGLDNPDAFYDSLRGSGLFGSALKPDQVEGLGAVLAAAKEAGWPVAFTAYALATAYHETAHTMQPVREAFWLSENWRKNNLKRYYPHYGRGYVQLTWPANYKRADDELGLGGTLVANLDLAMDPGIAAKIMARGMQEGWFCGDKSGKRHTLARHLPSSGAATLAQFTEARRIINLMDKAAKIGGEAAKFQTALQAGGW